VLLQYFQQLLQQVAVLVQAVLFRQSTAVQAVQVVHQPILEQVALQVHQGKATQVQHQVAPGVHQVAVAVQVLQVQAWWGNKVAMAATVCQIHIQVHL
jgi:hypothetical protein